MKFSNVKDATKGLVTQWATDIRSFDYSQLYRKEQRERSFFIALLPVIVTIATWPLLGFYRAAIFTEAFPYPLTVGMITSQFMFFIGSCYFIKQCFKRGFICCGYKHQPSFQEFYEEEKAAMKAQEKPKGPVTLSYCLHRFIHWGFFPGLFLVIFLYASATAGLYCDDNPNLCTVLFRADLFLWTLIFLAIINSPNRATRLDWIAGLINFVGISMLGWNYKYGVPIEFSENAKIFLAAALIVLSFGAYPIMLKKATLNSGIMKVIWVQSFYSTFFLMILGLTFEGKAPWWVAYETGRPGIVWHVLVFVVILSIWMWSIAMTVAYSDTITTSLALSFSLFLGDFGIASYVTDGYVFEWSSGIGLILVLIAFLWLCKRLIAENCQERFGKYCSWGNEGIGGDHSTDHLMELPEVDGPRQMSTYGAADQSSAYVDLSDRPATDTPKPKKKKKKQSQPVDM